MTQLTITVPPALEEWVNARLSEGRYADADDYVRDLIRRDQEAEEDETAWLREMIEEGLASGVVDADPREVIEQIIRERPAKRA